MKSKILQFVLSLVIAFALWMYVISIVSHDCEVVVVSLVKKEVYKACKHTVLRMVNELYF